MFRRLLICVCVATLAACSPAEAPPQPTPTAADAAITPASVRAMVEATSPTQAVATLWESGYSTFSDGVASGDAAWLDVVPLIQPGTDAGSSTELEMALSTALPRNAAGVLALLPDHGEYGGVCVNSAIEYAELSAADTAASNAAYYGAAIPAVEAVSDPALAAGKAACLTALRAAAV